MAISNLTTQYISASFQNLMQVSSSGLIYNGLGAQVTNLVLTSVTASFNGLATSASVAATVTTAAQPNITSVGTLTGLTVAGTLTANTYILSSSVTSMTVEFASGSTAFGNSSDDTHTFIGSVTVTGSLVVSGSSTFRNIGPAQFTGSVISTQGFTGSLQGTASIATNVAYSGLTGAVPTWNQNTTGNAATATLAATATNVAYTGLTGAVPTWNQNTTGNAATATSASTATSATTAATASFISSNFISASVASSGFGSSTPASASYSITSSYALSASYSISSSYSINASNANNTPYSGLTGAVTIWNQNTTGNADTATSASFATTASYIAPTFISASAAASGFGGATVSASYAATASYISPTFISASAAAAGFGTGGAAATGSVTINNNVNDYILTATGTANTLNGESALTFNGTTLGVGITSPFASVKAHIKGILGVENGLTGGTLADQLLFGYAASGLTQYNHKIQTSHDAVPALNKMDFLISNGASTFLNVLNLRSSNLSRFDSGQGLGVSGSLQVTGSTIITGNVNATSFTGSLQGTATTASYISPTFISASAAASGFGGATVSASYAATASYVLQAVSSSFATNASNTLITTQDTTSNTFNVVFTGGTSGYNSLNIDTTTLTYNPNTGIFGTDKITATNVSATSFTGSLQGTATTASYIDPTFISASAAASGFGGATVSASYAATASYVLQAVSASFVTTLAQDVAIAKSGGTLLSMTAGGAGGTEFRLLPNSTGGFARINVGNTTQPLDFQMNSSTKVTITQAGNVGIGTTTPTAVLDVNGNTKITGSLYNSSFAFISGGLVVGSELGGYVQSGNHKSQIIATGTQTPLLIQGGSGAVQIWKDTTPSRAVSFGMGVPGDSITNDFIFSAYQYSWAETMRITSAGSVGIGTTTPTATLDVNGNVYATSVTASFKGNLVGTSSWASNATNATNATTATNVAFSGITSLPAGISVTGVAAVEDITNSPATASLLTNGTFYSVAASTKVVKILLDEASMPIGTEFTFFAKNLTNPITFNVTPGSADSIISENGYLSMYGTGSAATAKLISTGPAVWALIGSLKTS